MYAPLLLEDNKWSKGIDPKLQSLLSELEAGLSSAIRKKDPSFRGRSGDGDENIGGGFAFLMLSLMWDEVGVDDSGVDGFSS